MALHVTETLRWLAFLSPSFLHLSVKKGLSFIKRQYSEEDKLFFVSPYPIAGKSFDHIYEATFRTSVRY